MTNLDELRTLFLDNKIHLVDIREVDEWKTGHIKGAILASMSSLSQLDAIQKLPSDRPLYLYCVSGNRAKLVKQLLQPFFTHPIHVVESGFTELKMHGFPTA